MESYQENKLGTKLIAKKDQTLCTEGKPVSTLLILKKGQVKYVKKIQGKIEFSLFTINAPAILNASFFLAGSVHGNSVVAVTECELFGYAFSQKNLDLILKQKSNILVLFVRSLFRDLVSLIPLVLESEKLKATLDNYIFNLTLFNSKLRPDKYIMSQISSKLSIDEKKSNKDEGGNKDPKENDNITKLSMWERRTLNDYYKFTLGSKSNDIDVSITAEFLHTSWLERLQLADIIENNFLSDDFPLLRSFFQLPSKTLMIIAKEAPKFLLQISDKILVDYHRCLQKVSKLLNKNWDNALILLLGNYSWTNQIEEQIELFSRNESLLERDTLFVVLKYFLEVYIVLEESFFNQINIYVRLQERMEQHRKIFNASLNLENNFVESNNNLKNNSEMSRKLKNLFFKILQWIPNFPKKESEQLYEQLVILRQEKNPFDTRESISKSRKLFNHLYWELYKFVAVKYYETPDSKQIPAYIKLLLNFGLLDEEFVESETLEALYYYQDVNIEKYPIYSPIEWITAIGSGVVLPSLNILGMTYLEFLNETHGEYLKSQNFEKKAWKTLEEVPTEFNSAEVRIRFEIDNAFKIGVRVSSGSPLNHLSILTKHHLIRNIKRYFVGKKELSEALDKLLNVDFSAFHREVFYEDLSLNISRQKIMNRVLPNFIMLPSVGTKTQFWQEREGRVRSSKGRILCNKLFHIIDLYDSIIKTTAIYRWELLKVVLGYDWNNISKPSLTADYTSYLQFFKDNRNLSPDVRRKISLEQKRLRSDQKMFEADYLQWIKNESEGNQILNKVVSSLFVKYLPLAKRTREKLAKFPKYEKDINRLQNIMGQKVKRYASIIKQLTEAGIEPPKEILETYHYYKLDI